MYTGKMSRSYAFRLVLPLLVVGAFARVPQLPTTFLDPKIVGGSAAEISLHPHQLSLQRSSHTCGASIISSKWAVTAGHCVSSSGAAYRVSAGSNDKYGGEYYQVKNVIRHPKYNAWTTDFDIALLEMAEEIRFNERVQPVRLADEEPASGRMVNVTGWGALSSGGPSPSVLMKVSVPIVDRKTCSDAYKPNYDISERMICAGYLNEGGKDSCQGDSGGPLTADGVLYGIVSWGYGCAHPSYPGVYTNVASLRSWVKDTCGV